MLSSQSQFSLPGKNAQSEPESVGDQFRWTS